MIYTAPSVPHRSVSHIPCKGPVYSCDNLQMGRADSNVIQAPQKSCNLLVLQFIWSHSLSLRRSIWLSICPAILCPSTCPSMHLSDCPSPPVAVPLFVCASRHWLAGSPVLIQPSFTPPFIFLRSGDTCCLMCGFLSSIGSKVTVIL